ncbi:hypothetical protein [Gimesia sp.]|uniref:hypothetical protein n=1 Tax=Gimesia sp. TaxID=2024833 RepID=UPI0025B9779E|nr:hypothetical protein [Gimesia sp.]
MNQKSIPETGIVFEEYSLIPTNYPVLSHNSQRKGPTMMNRFKLTFSMGTCFLFFCLAGDANQSVAKDKTEEPKLITCVCNQVRLAPVGVDLWMWMAYKYQYDTDCNAATAVSVIEYDTYDETATYPQEFCNGSSGCGACSPRFIPKDKNDQKKSSVEPPITHYMHPLPASPTARLDLYPPETKLHYDILETRILQFGTPMSRVKYAKVFFVCASKSENPTEQSDAYYFWYGFEVYGKADKIPVMLPYSYSEKRATYYMPDSSDGKCREYAFINYAGSQFLIRFKEEVKPEDRNIDCQDQKNSK